MNTEATTPEEGKLTRYFMGSFRKSSRGLRDVVTSEAAAVVDLMSGYETHAQTTLLDRFGSGTIEPHAVERYASGWLDIGGSTYLEAEDTVQKLDEIYGIEDTERLKAWLGYHPKARDVLLHAIPFAVNTIFESPGLKLQVKHDPEEPSFPSLIVTVLSYSETSEAATKLFNFIEKWGSKIKSMLEGHIIFDVEVKP